MHGRFASSVTLCLVPCLLYKKCSQSCPRHTFLLVEQTGRKIRSLFKCRTIRYSSAGSTEQATSRCEVSSLQILGVSDNVLVKSKLPNSPPPLPGQPPGHLNLWKIFVQIPASPCRKAVQIAHHTFITGDQMPSPPGKLPDYCFNFSVASI